jgi:hypothetical protein
VFRSPVVYRPYAGREAVLKVLEPAERVAGSFNHPTLTRGERVPRTRGPHFRDLCAPRLASTTSPPSGVRGARFQHGERHASAMATA